MIREVDFMRRQETHKFALETRVGEPFDADTVTDLDGRLLSVLADSNDLADTFVTTYQWTVGKSAHRYFRRPGRHERNAGDGPVVVLDVQIYRRKFI